MSDATRIESLLGSARAGEVVPAPGAPPIPVARPASEDEAQELLRLAARERWRVLPMGLGTKLGWCRPPQRADLALSTADLRGVVAYEPGDGTVAARAGTRMDELAAAVRAGGHRLTPDAPRPGEATLGGVLAAGESGPDRLRFGPARHHVLGMRVLLANGELAKSGGRLVKNVTGYDLHRLYCGSHGTLCAIVEATLRLFPLPEASAHASETFDGLEAALEAARSLLAAELRPTNVCVAGEDGRYALHVALDGRAEVVAWERELLSATLPRASWLDGDAAFERAAELRDRAPDARAAPSLRATCLPSRLAETARRVLARVPGASRLLLQPGVASLELALERVAPKEAAELVRGLRVELEPLGARLAARGLGWSAAGELDPLGEPGAALPWMHRLRRQLDPDGRFATGRFHGGL